MSKKIKDSKKSLQNQIRDLHKMICELRSDINEEGELHEHSLIENVWYNNEPDSIGGCIKMNSTGRKVRKKMLLEEIKRYQRFDGQIGKLTTQIMELYEAAGFELKTLWDRK